MQIIYLLAAEWSIFLAFYLFNLWLEGWFKAPTLGGGIFLTGLILVELYLICQTRIHRKSQIKQPLDRLTNHFLHKSIIVIIINLLVLLLWVGSLTLKIFPFREINPYQGVLLFVSIVLAQVWIFPLLEKKSELDGDFRKDIGRKTGIWWLTGIYLGSVFLKILFITPIVHNLVFNYDSFQYWSMAARLFNGSFSIVDYNHYPPLYPLLISPVFLFGELHSLANISIINAIISSSAIFPVYLLSREFLTRRYSIGLALLCAIFPFQMVYPSLLASENLAYPLFFWAAYFTFSAAPSHRWRIVWDTLTAISIGALWLTRYQTLVMIPVFLLTWWLKPVAGNAEVSLRPTREKIIRLIAICFGIGFMFSPWAFLGINNGLPIRQIVGTQIYTGSTSVSRDFLDLVFWGGLTVAYLILMAVPVLTPILSKAFHWKLSLQDKKLLRWVIFVITLAGILFITITNHAYRAGYNYPVPNRLLGRYILYLSVLVWITAIIFIQKKRDVSLRRKWIVGILVFLAGVASYQIFNNPDWILSRSILYSIFVDGYLPSLIPFSFFVLLLFSITTTIYWESMRRIPLATGFLIGSMAAIFFWSYPGYFQKLADQNTFGKHLDTMIQYLISEKKMESTPISQIKWFNTDSGFSIEKELSVRGLYSPDTRIKSLSGNPAGEYKCKTRLMAQYPGGERFAIIEINESCTFPETEWLNAYVFGGTRFAVVELDRK
jgi:hypothetical protein